MKRRYLKKIILTYFSIIYGMVLLVLSVSAVFIQQKNHSALQSQEIMLFRRQIADYETLYEDMFNISNDIKKMTSVDLYALSSEKNYYSNMADVQKELRQYSQQYQRNGYGIIVHLFHDHKMITEASTVDCQYQLPQIGLTVSEYNGLLDELVRYNKKYLLLFTDEQLIYMTNKNYMNHDIIIVINCPFRQLDFEERDPSQFAMTINDENVKDLRTLKETGFSPDTEDMVTEEIVFSKTGNKLFLQARSHFYNIVYSRLSHVSFYTSLWRVMVYVLLVPILIFIPILLLIAGVSKRIYRPINELISTVSTEEGSEDNGKDNEIDFLMGRVRNIQAQNQELIQTAGVHRYLVIQSILVKLVSNAYDHSIIYDAMKETGVTWLDGPCFMVIFDMPLKSPENIIAAPDIVDILKGCFSKGKTCIYTELTDNGICCVFPENTGGSGGVDPQSISDIDSVASLQRYLHMALLKAEKEEGCTLTAYIAPKSLDMNTLSSSYNIGVFMKEESVRLPLKNIYMYEDYGWLFENSIGYPLSIEKDLIGAVSEGDWNHVEKMIDEVFDIYISRTFYEKNLREMNIISLINTINRSIQKASLSVGDLLADNQYLFLELKMCSTLQELCDRTKEIYGMIVSKCKTKQSLRSENFGYQLKQYIENNYQRDISLNDMADNFSLSPNYMSLIFKKTLNSTFKEYLSRFRCEKARVLLREQPGIRIGEVSELIGIPNVNTFIRIFKKDCGMSPGQYQSKMKG